MRTPIQSSPARRRAQWRGVLLLLLLVGLLAGSAAHGHHDADEGGQPCAACHLDSTPAPQPLALERVEQPLERAGLPPAPGPELRAPAARLAARAPPLRIAA